MKTQSSAKERMHKYFYCLTILQGSKSMERLYEDMEAGDETSELGKKYLFNLYAKNHNLEKLLNLKEVRFEFETTVTSI